MYNKVKSGEASAMNLWLRLGGGVGGEVGQLGGGAKIWVHENGGGQNLSARNFGLSNIFCNFNWNQHFFAPQCIPYSAYYSAGMWLCSQLANFSQFWYKFCHLWDQCKSSEKMIPCMGLWGIGVFAIQEQLHKCYSCRRFLHILTNFMSCQSHPCYRCRLP